MMYKFAPASPEEPIVFGAARPQSGAVPEWLDFMQDQGITRVVCLLEESRCRDLLEVYRSTFGATNVHWSPIEDFQVATIEQMRSILAFLGESDRQQKKVIVHCAGGIGRTGQVLTAWLVAGRGFAIEDAVSAVRESRRNPYEAVLAAPFKGRNPWQMEQALTELFNAFQP